MRILPDSYIKQYYVASTVGNGHQGNNSEGYLRLHHIKKAEASYVIGGNHCPGNHWSKQGIPLLTQTIVALQIFFLPKEACLI